MPRPVIWLLIAAPATLMIVFFILVLTRPGAEAPRQAGVRISGEANIGGPFTLVDQTGATVTEADFRGKAMLIYFGYTYCPDVCPYDMARNAEAVTMLEEQGYSVKPVFISIDPERDTPEQLADFTDYLHPRLVGLTGSAEQIKAASQAYRTYYKKQEPEDGDEDYYLVDHSTFTYLTLPEEGFVEYFRRDETPEAMAEKVACFLDAR